MKAQTLEHQLEQIIYANEWFMTVLRAARDCALPNWFIGAGVIRNITWDYLHEYTQPTPVTDIDVAFFDPSNLSPEHDKAMDAQLKNHLSDVDWEATNQAAVHLWYEKLFGHAVPPLNSSEEAIGTWPETATCIGVRLLENDELMIVAPFGLTDLFQMNLRRNPSRVSLKRFRQRALDKEILKKWPKVCLIDE